MLISKSKLSMFNSTFLMGRFGILKIIVLLQFFDKKTKKKLVSLYGIVAQFNQCILGRAFIKKRPVTWFFYYSRSYFIFFLLVLRRFGYIFGVFSIPFRFFIALFKYGFKFDFVNRVLLVFLNVARVMNSLFFIEMLSKPSRIIYLSFKSLRRLTRGIVHSPLLLLNTSRGILVHMQAISIFIGGTLICRII